MRFGLVGPRRASRVQHALAPSARLSSWYAGYGIYMALSSSRRRGPGNAAAARVSEAALMADSIWMPT